MRGARRVRSVVCTTSDGPASDYARGRDLPVDVDAAGFDDRAPPRSAAAASCAAFPEEADRAEPVERDQQ